MLVRRLVAAVVVAALAAACSPEQVNDAIDEVVTAPDEQPAEGASNDDAAQAPAEDPSSGQDDTAETPQDPGAPAEDPPADDEPADDPAAEEGTAEAPAQEQPGLSPLTDGGPVGGNAAAYLRGDRPRVVIEVDVQDGAALSNSVLEHVRSVLDRESAASVEVVTGAASLPRRDAWTPAQLRQGAASTRDVAHGDDVAVLHLLVLRDGYEDDGVLGVAFDSSSAVVFPDQWSDLTTALLAGDRIARAVTTHEVGHLLGLVGLFEEPTSDHEDPEHPGHTTDEDDVMFWAVERNIIAQLDGIPDDFGPASRADLAAIRDR